MTSTTSATPIDWHVLVAVNYGFDDLFTNWLTFFERLHTGMPVHIVAEDEAVRSKYADRRDVRLFSSPSAAPPAHAARLDASSWGDPIYKDMIARRPAYIREALSQLGHVIFTDVDTVWLRDPRPHLVPSGGAAPDFQMLAEGACGRIRIRVGMRYNNGFMAMRNSRGSQAAWQWVGDAFDRRGARNVSGDQELLNRFFTRCGGAAAEASVRALPSPAFAGGCHFPAWMVDRKIGAGRVRDTAPARPCILLNATTTRLRDDAASREAAAASSAMPLQLANHDWAAVPAGEDLVVAHATWVIGKATKIRLLESAGLWCAGAGGLTRAWRHEHGATARAEAAATTTTNATTTTQARAHTPPPLMPRRRTAAARAASRLPSSTRPARAARNIVLARAARALDALVHGAPAVRHPPTNERGLWADTPCAQFEVGDFPSGFQRFVAPLTGSGSGTAGPVRGIAAEAGGKWTPCMHLSTYGLITAPFVQRFLAFAVQPTRALEVGCGLGTTADYLARFTPGGSEVSCIEPNPMLTELFGRRQLPSRPTQLAVELFPHWGEEQPPATGGGGDGGGGGGSGGGAAARRCARTLSQRQFDLVYSIEVAEHQPPQWQQRLVHLMRDASRGLVVFSAARPAQPGIGHLNTSMRTKADWISAFEAAGMVLMPRLSATLSRLAFPERACDIALNVFVMRKADAPPALANESAILARGGALLERNALFPSDEVAYGPPPHAWRRDDNEPWSREMQEQCVNRGINPSRAKLRLTEAALWPELDALQTILQKRPDACST